MRLLTAVLALALLGATVPAMSLAAEAPEPIRALEDSVRLQLQGFPLLDADQAAASIAGAAEEAAQKQIDRAVAEQQLNLAKAELRALGLKRVVSLALYDGPDETCEREAIGAWYHEEQARLNGVIKAQRRILGDRRSFFTKAWHRLGPAGRRIARALFDEALPIIIGSGTLSGGVARSLTIRTGRRELKHAVVRGLVRKITRGAENAAAQAEEHCRSGSGSVMTSASPAGEATPKPGLNSGTGKVRISGIYQQPYVYAGMQWEDYLGPTCPDYQAYNPSTTNPYLPGIEVGLVLDLDAGTFSGRIKGPTHGAQVGSDAWGSVDLEIREGRVSQSADGSGWDLSAEAVATVSYGMDGYCASEEGPNYLESKVHETPGVAAVTGEVDLHNVRWTLELEATRQQGEENFHLDLRDIEIGRWEE